jgi:DNA-binding NarL/FixJ family response regulator
VADPAAPGRPRIRVLVADDHAVVRRGLITFLQVQGDIEVVGEAADGTACLAAVAALCPDVLLLDLKLPDRDGTDVLRALAAGAALRTHTHHPGSGAAGGPGAAGGSGSADGPGAAAPRVLVVTSFTDLTTTVPAIRAGASGLVYKDVSPAALADAIRSVHAGHVVLPPDVANALASGDGGPRRLAQLTPRERDVLAEIARGRSNREIARTLVLSEKTVKTHVSSILTKLDVADRTQAALYAVRHT